MLLAALLLAQAATAPCTGTIDAALPVPLAGWTAPGSTVVLGKAALLDTADPATLPIPAGSKPRAASVLFTVPQAGVYGIALDQKGWIDVVPATGGDALKSVSHREGDPCWSIRKLVRFQLDAGAYRLTLTGLSGPKAKAMIEQGE
ncbi:MAG: hypothetical protein WDN44_04770 [Sphingomonas sp.]